MDKLKMSDETLEQFAEFSRIVAGTGVSAVEAHYNWLRCCGHNVILTPDDEIIEVTDAPAIEYPDGRKYKADGTVYDE